MKSISAPPPSTVQLLLGEASQKWLRMPASSMRGAAIQGDAAFLRNLIAAGHDGRSIVEDAKLSTLLMIAAEHGRAECVEVLLPVSDPNQATREGDTALSMAAEQGHAECARLLLAAGANPKAQDRHGATPLMHASRAARVAAIELLAPVSEIDAVDRGGMSALTRAVESRREAAVRALLRAGANPRLEGAHGMNALMRAASEDAPDVMEILLPVSDAREIDQYGRTPMAIALERGHWRCADLLAPWVDPREAQAAFEQAGPESMPRWAAEIERRALARAAAIPDIGSEIESGRRSENGSEMGLDFGAEFAAEAAVPRRAPHRL